MEKLGAGLGSAGLSPQVRAQAGVAPLLRNGPDDQVQVRCPQGGKGLGDDDGDEDNDDNEDDKDCNYIEDEEKSTQ